MPPLCTIGYESVALPALIDTLRANAVQHVIDVRQLPLSRRPGFSKRTLAASLDEAGIAYTHLRALGTPAEGREANRRRRWPEFWAIVDRSLATPEARHALEQAATIATTQPTCLLCLEADPHICHRLRIAEHLGAAHALPIHHLDPR